MLVAGHDEIGLGGERYSKHHIIIGIRRHGAGECRRLDDLGKDAVAFDKHRDRQLLLRQTPREALARQNSGKLLNQNGRGKNLDALINGRPNECAWRAIP